MKVVQLFQIRLCKSLSFKRANQFAQLAKEADQEDDINKYTNAKEYYDYLLRFTPQDERGYIKFHPGQFTKMVRIASTEEDIKSIRDAYYNFLGHKQKFTNAQVDRFLEKAAELKAAPLINEILINHNFLMYYPHSSVLHKLAEHYIQENNAEGLNELTRIYSNTHFLKLEDRTLELVSNYAIEQKNQGIILNLAQIAYRKVITSINENTINNILTGIARHKIANPEPKEGTQNKVETKFLAHLKKCSQSYHTIIGRAYLALASKDIDGSLVNLSNFNQIDQTKVSTQNIISNSAITQEFFEYLEQQIAESKKTKYAERLAKVTADIQSKLGQKSIHQDISTIIQKIITSSQSISNEGEQQQ
ncbi:hypothetical protein ABPG72_020197 [Tetrahymena utriculariae]